MKKALNLGCGGDIRRSTHEVEWVNLDIDRLDGVDITHDLDEFPWPFEDEEFDAIIAFDIWEHVREWRGFMREVHRILRPGAQVKIRTCAYGVEQGFRDPDHKRWATEDTFRYWTPGHWLCEAYPGYSGGAHFRYVSGRRAGDNWEFLLEKLP